MILRCVRKTDLGNLACGRMQGQRDRMVDMLRWAWRPENLSRSYFGVLVFLGGLDLAGVKCRGWGLEQGQNNGTLLRWIAKSDHGLLWSSYGKILKDPLINSWLYIFILNKSKTYIYWFKISTLEKWFSQTRKIFIIFGMQMGFSSSECFQSGAH